MSKLNQTNMSRKTLNYSEINAEYLSWSLENGDGRNKDDLRFGQYLDHKYDLELHMSDRSVGLFYEESCENVYSAILRQLYKLEDEK